MQTIGERLHDRLQHFTIALVRTAFSFCLKFSVEFKHVGVRKALPVGRKDGPQDGQNPRFPVD